MLIGREIFIAISFALTYLSLEQAVRMLTNHPADYLLIGSDCPGGATRGQTDSKNRISIQSV